MGIKNTLNRKVPSWITLSVIFFMFGWTFIYLWSGFKSGQRMETYYALQNFSDCISRYVIDTGKIPGPTFEEAVTMVLKESETNESLKCCLERKRNTLTILKNNQDAWGRPFVFEQKDDGFLIILRSLGANGRDEGGKGDDYQKIVDIRWMKSSIEPKTEK